MEKMTVGAFMRLGDNPRADLKKVEDLGFTNMQTPPPPDEFFEEPRRGELVEAVRESKVGITTMFVSFKGESYADIPAVRRTVGFLNPELREERLERTFEISDLAKALGVEKVAAHVGFIPEDPDDPDYQAMVDVVGRIADHCGKNDQCFCLETGQETAEVLLRFIKDVGRDNIRVNFDPANMILYGAGDPIEALDVLGPYVAGVHAKDGKWPTEKGKLGQEYPLGQGDVGIEGFIEKLKEIGYKGPLTIEREITGEQQIRDILTAKKLLESLI